MATNKICDVCNNPAAQPVHVVRLSIEVLAAVDGSQSTGCVHEVEACEGCWPKAMDDLSANVREQLTRDIPVHRQVYAINHEIAACGAELRAAVARRDELQTGTPGHARAAGEVQKLESMIADHETQRAELLAQAN